MIVKYFSEVERGPRARLTESIGEGVWGGIVALINAFVASGAFGADFPAECEDGRGVCGTNGYTLGLAVRAEIPGINWPLPATDVPPPLVVLDVLQFCVEHVAKAESYECHSYWRHDHLNFDREQGRADFLERVERIFARNGLAYELREDSSVQRLAPDGFREALDSGRFQTGDSELDALLEAARAKFLSADPHVRRDSLEKLWDAFERLKSLDDPKDKRSSVAALLDRAAPEITFRSRLESEAKELTDIGNKFRIRHSETSQVQIERDGHVDYLFHRLFALVQLLVRKGPPT